MAGIIVRPRARIFHGHDWVFNTEVLKVFGDPEPGSIVSIKDGRDRMLGSAIYNPHSQIVARRYSRRREKLDLDLFTRRIKQADEFRKQWTRNWNPGRLFWSESDGLPGLIVDRYGEHFVVQTLTLAMDQRKSLIVEALDTLFAPASIIERNDAPVRRAEGLELINSVFKGDAPERFKISIGGIFFELELLTGQKTGFYLDQIENYQEVARLASGKRVLDCFANQGAFGLACARTGAASVTVVEIGENLAPIIEQNARLNHVTLSVYTRNVFDFLSEQVRKGETYDLIILDPPSFTRSRETLGNARRGYKEIHLRALQILAPDGLLATFACSHHISRSMLQEIVVEASIDAKRQVRLIRSLSQPPDHPILPHIPETEYLKGFIFQLLPGR
jgi:23S rRNA (cytosine1962-C5)-methyltransferase